MSVHQYVLHNKSKRYCQVWYEPGRPVLREELDNAQTIAGEFVQDFIASLVGRGFYQGAFKVVQAASGNRVNNFAVQAGIGWSALGWHLYFDVEQNYTAQPDWTTPTALTTPVSDRTDKVYLDVWREEIDSSVDSGILHPNIGIETAHRIKTFIRIRVSEGAAIPAAPGGHEYIPLATLNRLTGNSEVLSAMIVDDRTRVPEQLSAKVVVDALGDVLGLDAASVQNMLPSTNTGDTGNDKFWSIDAVRNYVASYVQGLDPQESVLDFWDASSGLPPTPVAGDRYICSVSGNGWVIHSIYTYTGSVWSAGVPNKGWATFVENLTQRWVFNGTVWVKDAALESHGDLQNILGADETDTDATKNKHVSNAQLKVFNDHKNNMSNPHGITALQILPAVAGNGLKYLRVKSDETGFEYATAGGSGEAVKYPFIAAGSKAANQIDYVAGDFDSPDESLGMTQFCPMLSNSTAVSRLYVGTKAWVGNAVGAACSWVNYATGTAGAVRFACPSGETWSSFAIAATNGLKTIKLPKTATNDELGGVINFWYEKSIWETWFKGRGEDCIVTLDGSVYRGSILAENCVILGNGSVPFVDEGANKKVVIPYSKHNIVFDSVPKVLTARRDRGFFYEVYPADVRMRDNLLLHTKCENRLSIMRPARGPLMSVTGSLTFPTGRFGLGVQCAASNYFSLADAVTELQLNDYGMLEFWAYFPDTMPAVGNYYFFGMTVSAFTLWLEIDSGGNFIFHLTRGSLVWGQGTPQTYSAGWHHIAVAWTKDPVPSLYISGNRCVAVAYDGVVWDSEAGTSLETLSNGVLRFGVDNSGGNAFPGPIDNIRVRAGYRNTFVDRLSESPTVEQDVEIVMPNDNELHGLILG